MSEQYSRFDFEQDIFKCWNVVGDLDTLYNSYTDLTEDQRLNIILGLKELYNVRFSQLMDAYEVLVARKEIK